MLIALHAVTRLACVCRSHQVSLCSPRHRPLHGRQQLLTYLHISGQSPGINTPAVGELQLDVDNIRRDLDGYKCSVSAQHLIVVAARNKEMSPLCAHTGHQAVSPHLIWSYVTTASDEGPHEDS